MLTKRGSELSLIVANGVPIVGVLLWHWSVFDIVFLYWAENLVIGLFNLLRMAVAKQGRLTERLFLLPFFVVHYGMFCFGHGTLLFSLFHTEAHDASLLDTATATLASPMMLAAAMALFISHLMSFFSNYLGNGEYRNTSASNLMARPYARIMIMHVTLLAGAFAIQAFGSPLILLLLLVVLKTGLDLRAHRQERSLLSLEAA